MRIFLYTEYDYDCYILQMETVMKQAEEAKRNAQDSARRLLEEYRPLKHDVDLMRTELLGLEKLPDLPQGDKERMGSIGYVRNV